MFDKLNDKKWDTPNLFNLESRRNRIAYLMNLITEEINLVMDTDALTFMSATNRLYMLSSLQDAREKLESAHLEIESWIRSPDIFKP